MARVLESTTRATSTARDKERRLREVGAMKGSGKKGDKCKKDYGKGKYGKSFGKYDKNLENSKNNEYGKGHEKGNDKGKKGKGRKTRKG